MNKQALSPLMQQYLTLKTKYADCILLFQVGDFYETFGEDAAIASRILGLALTKRHGETDMAGFPCSALGEYLPELAAVGCRVAVCDQMPEVPGSTGLLERKVTQVVTPGIPTGDGTAEHASTFLAALHIDAASYGLALLDMSTGEFYAGEGDKGYILRLLDSFRPAEIIFERNFDGYFREAFGHHCYGYGLDPSAFDSAGARQQLLDHFRVLSLKGFGLENLNQATIACGAILHYLRDTEHPNMQHITAIQTLDREGCLWMDAFTVRNLELTPEAAGKKTRTLLDVLDSTVNPMGSRLLKRWLSLPLKDLSKINERLDLVEHFLLEGRVRGLISDHIRACGDLERLSGKVALGKINPRQVRSVAASLTEIANVREICRASPHGYLQTLAETLDTCQPLTEKINREILDEPAASTGKGYVIRPGVDPALDELKELSANSKHFLDYLQQREAGATGIHNLKIGYHGTYGYYLEVPKSLKARVPAHWSLKHTTSGAERYSTDELKEYEARILTADEQIKEMEAAIFQALITALKDFIVPLQTNGQTLALLDCLASFATNALQYRYVKPVLHDGGLLDLRDSRHPVIEQGCSYVANDISLDPESQQMIILTGPNMSGKSALLRQTALITLMAHIGSFVPASYARIPLTDKIFTRVGASDNLSGGESTFMVEMNETASIMHGLTPQSLVLLDEIGRGTATYDGISIAWSIVEYLHHSAARPKTLFATHYHELNELEIKLSRVANYHLTHEVRDGAIVFLRKLAPGGSLHSFGLHVAKMAGMPQLIIDRAQMILEELEATRASL